MIFLVPETTLANQTSGSACDSLSLLCWCL